MSKELKKLPVGLQGFREIIEDDYLYVDKTEYLYNLIKGGKVYFLSRPRRFGKSLTCSTFEEIFSGNKELFKGFWIYNSDYEWKKYPVIHLSFTTLGYKTDEELEENIIWFLNVVAKKYDIDISQAPSIGPKFYTLIEEIFKKHGPVVIIIDEYDKPLIEHITDSEKAQKNRDVLKSFYDTFKDVQKFLRFIFITGVSKFSKTSIFSSMNNLKDISLDDRVSTMLGYTKKEILETFSDYITRFSEQKQFTKEQMMQELTEWYDGYCFQKPPFASTVAKAMADRQVASEDRPANKQNEQNYKIYNPFSILLALDMQNIDNYWFQSGTPTFLIKLIKEQDYPLLKLEEKIEINQGSMGKFEVGHVPLENLLFQTGYLTITSYDSESFNFKLKFPNREVRDSFTKDIIESMTKLEVAQYSNYIKEFRRSLFSNDLDKFFKTIHTFFASIPYDIQITAGKKKQISEEKRLRMEKYYQSIFYVTMKLIGMDVIVEDRTNIGRIDAVVKTNSHVYVIEFKINKSANKALEQIQDKKYYEKFRLEDKKLVLIGLNFDLKEKNVLKSGWVVEEL
ncbi:ATP-binding protein [Candidatus Babeliales bacterium]|nr:ATP-binding protein [Candidatus Babeliales bacterium]MCF7899290.1 ATP-binding protein [Candidatus Babeliales bacterium]